VALKICVIGLGYVGLPLAVVLARHYQVTGYDVDGGRIAELREGYDITGEVSSSDLDSCAMKLSDDPDDLASYDIYIVTVPTPVDETNEPDLSALRAACGVVGKAMAKGAVVVFESTVYPGVTEEVCGTELAAAAGLKCGKDFFLGYSPERVNPGDKEHRVDKIAKIVAGQTPEVTATLEEIYGNVTRSGVFTARDIKTAEAAKVIENAQRDINIAFINEVSQIFQNLGLSVQDVLDAATTKWNFLPFKPGLVGGHCIGVDPFYLAHCAKEVGHHPEIILAGRRINDGMGGFIAERIDAALRSEDKDKDKTARILMLGLTFKENVPDLRNSKVIDVIRRLCELGHEVTVHDPLADAAQAKALYGVELCTEEDVSKAGGNGAFDCVVGAVAHDLYGRLSSESFAQMVAPGGLVADIKGLWRHIDLPGGVRRWDL
jgi:UDP-N-acetyl-D-galactosamine dehydrogenase